TWPVEDARGTVVLIGDSNAGHFSEPVIAADRSLRLTTVVATAPWCPFLDHLAVFDAGALETDCVNFVRGSLQWLRKERPNLVIIGARSDAYIEDGRFALAQAGEPARVAAADRARLWEAALHTTAAELARVNIPVIVVHPVPERPDADRGVCAPLL